MCDTFSGMNSCYSWQNRTVDMELHVSLLHNSTPWCSDVVVIAGSLSSLKLVYEQSHPGLCFCLLHDHTVCFVYCPELSAKHFAEFPFLLLLCNPFFPCPSQLYEVSFFFGLSIPEREQLLQRSLKYEVRHQRD